MDLQGIWVSVGTKRWSEHVLLGKQAESSGADILIFVVDSFYHFYFLQKILIAQFNTFLYSSTSCFRYKLFNQSCDASP